MIITIIIIFKLALVAQRIERSPAKAEVGGSIPLKRAISRINLIEIIEIKNSMKI